MLDRSGEGGAKVTASTGPSSTVVIATNYILSNPHKALRGCSYAAKSKPARTGCSCPSSKARPVATAPESLGFLLVNKRCLVDGESRVSGTWPRPARPFMPLHGQLQAK